jgi:hypothetical protein
MNKLHIAYGLTLLNFVTKVPAGGSEKPKHVAHCWTDLMWCVRRYTSLVLQLQVTQQDETL